MKVSFKAPIIFGENGIAVSKNKPICIELTPANCWYSGDEILNEFQRQFPEDDFRSYFKNDWDRSREREGVAYPAEYLDAVLGETKIVLSQVKIAGVHDKESATGFAWNQELGLFQGPDGEYVFWQEHFGKRLAKVIPDEILSWYQNYKMFPVTVFEGRIYNCKSKEWYAYEQGEYFWQKAPNEKDSSVVRSYTNFVKHPWD